MSTATPQRPAANPPNRQTITSETFSQVQSLAQRIQGMLPREQAGGHIVGVTSCSRQEGVSVVAGNLAVCASEIYSGKVLLIDANPQHASVAGRFGVRQTPGLSDCLSHALAARECVAATNHSNLYVLPAGALPPRSSRFSEERVAALFANLRQDFELIVIDLPPANALDEMFIASQRVDGILLVLEAERIRRQVAQRVQRQLKQADVMLLGVVLNKRNNHVPEWLYRRL